MQRKRKGFRRKPEPKFKFRINKMIRVSDVRLVGENVKPGVYDIRDAQRIANDLELDLVEISPKADPPVCKIIDYRKFLYDKKKKEKEMKSKQVKTVIKEIRFTPNTDEHDFEFKAKHAERFLQEGSKVKTYVHFKGRHIVFKDRGEMLLLRFAQRLEEWGIPEQMPKMEGRRMNMFLAPKKVQKVKPKSKPEGGESKKTKSDKPAAEAVAETKVEQAAEATSDTGVKQASASKETSDAAVKQTTAGKETADAATKQTSTDKETGDAAVKQTSTDKETGDAAAKQTTADKETGDAAVKQTADAAKDTEAKETNDSAVKETNDSPVKETSDVSKSDVSKGEA